MNETVLRDDDPRPLVVGLGGTTREHSSSQRALGIALEAAQGFGARTLLLGARDLLLPMYEPDIATREPAAARLVAAIARADGIIISSPGYHGGPSGLVKNALDYVEELRTDARPYLDGRAVGCIACASGWQATATTLVSLRSIVHALRGWPTPLGVAINSADAPFGSAGAPAEVVRTQLEIMGGQVVGFARRHAERAPVAGTRRAMAPAAPPAGGRRSR